MDTTTKDKQEPIAIIGVGCRLPGNVGQLEDLYSMLAQGKNGYKEIPADRWNADAWYHPNPDRQGAIVTKHGFFLDQEIGHFDAPFFSMTTAEAAAMDPMKRMLLEVSYEAIENAGIPMESLLNSQTGCYVGSMANDFLLSSTHDLYDLGAQAAAGTSNAMAANRVSWFYGLRGPSLTLDTACSSSLYALHLAVQSLRSGETDMNLACGINLITNPATSRQLSGMHMISPDGISHTFDERANGYGRGEGIGCIVLKRLDDALRDGDTIRAVIRGTGANGDGRTTSITQPSSEAQAELIQRTYANAGIPLDSTQYFECHGTGTPVGDPIEVSAIASTLGAARVASTAAPLYIGSIKPSVGHTEGCAGLAGILKSITLLEKGTLVPTYGVERVSSKLKLKERNLLLPKEVMPWPTEGQRRISVNSFGFGGSNAHVILDDAYHYLTERGLLANHSTTASDEGSGSDSGFSSASTSLTSTETQAAKRLFVFSAKDQAGIKRLASAYAQHLSTNVDDNKEGTYLRDLAFTLSNRRSRLSHSSFVVAHSIDELTTRLNATLPIIKQSSRLNTSVDLFWIFTGQGAQWPTMGRELLDHPIFSASVSRSQLILDELQCPWNAISELRKKEDSSIHLPEFSQPLCTVLQIALVDLFFHWGIRPRATVGHSSGEIAAAYAASYITQEDAIRVAYVRGLVSARVTRPGAMLAASMSSKEAEMFIDAHAPEAVVVACVNSPSSVTLSGDADAIDALERILGDAGKSARKLKVKTAYHSHHMQAVMQDYLDLIGTIEPRLASISGDGITMFSSLYGRKAESTEVDAAYWAANLCSSVQFSAAVTSLLKHRFPSTNGTSKSSPVRWAGIVEIGPHATLKGPVQQIISASGTRGAESAIYTSPIMRGHDAHQTALEACGQLWGLGYSVDFSQVNDLPQGEPLGPKVLTNLPSYPWNHGRDLWHESAIFRSLRQSAGPRTDLLGRAEPIQNSFEPRWRNTLRISENPWIEDHQVTGTVLYPAAGLIVMALEAALQMAKAGSEVHGFHLRNLRFQRGLVVPSDDEAVETRLSLIPDKETPGNFDFAVYSQASGGTWIEHCTGSILLEYVDNHSSHLESAARDAIWAQHRASMHNLQHNPDSLVLNTEEFYDKLEKIGMEYGPLFRNCDALTAHPALLSSHGTISVPETKSSMPEQYEYDHIIHPATMDAIFHVLLGAYFNDPSAQAVVPYGIEHLFISREQPHDPEARYCAYARITDGVAENELTGDLFVGDEGFEHPRIIATGFSLRQVTASGAESTAQSSAAEKKCCRVVWKEDLHLARFERLFDEKEEENAVARCIDLMSHKRPIKEVLIVLDAEVGDVADYQGYVDAFEQQKHAYGKVTAISTSMAVSASSWGVHLSSGDHCWDTTEDQDLPISTTNFDLIVIIGSQSIASSAGSISKLVDALSPSGYLISIGKSTSSSSPSNFSTAGLESRTISQRSHLGISISLLHISSDTPSLPSHIILLVPEFASPQIWRMSRSLTNHFLTLGITTTTIEFTSSNASFAKDQYIISLLEVIQPMIFSWIEVQMNTFRSIILQAAHLFWISRGSSLDSWSNGVEFAPAQGLLRTLRNEYQNVVLPHLDLSVGLNLASEELAKVVASTWQTTMAGPCELEFAERDGSVYIPRVVSEVNFDNELQLAAGTADPILQPIGNIPRILSTTGPHVWISDESAATALAQDEVEVSVEYIAPNQRIANSTTSLNSISHQAVGLVRTCGDGVQSLKPGQRVALLYKGPIRTHIRQHESLVVPLPFVMAQGKDLLPFEAVALLKAHMTAQYLCIDVARLKEGQKILLHDAASATGQAIIQVSRSLNVEIFALVASQAEKDILVEQLQFSASHIFDSRHPTYLSAILESTNGAGVNVVIRSHCDRDSGPSAAVLAHFGYYFDLSPVDENAPKVILPANKHNVSLIRIDMDRLMDSRPDILSELLRRSIRTFYADGEVQPLSPSTTFSLTETKAVFEHLKSRPPGQPVLSVTPESMVLVPSPSAPKLTLNPDATYILAGGLGALGLEIASMMVDCGAKHLVFLSRSGGGAVKAQLDSLRARDARIDAFACDVTHPDAVSDIFTALRAEGCIIEGVVQMAMVLNDTLFENMTHEQWTRAFNIKTKGSLNLLHNIRPEDNPFFIMFSSITGIMGNSAQANYAAGNTFEDSLAHYARSHLGIKAATSLDIALVIDCTHITGMAHSGAIESAMADGVDAYLRKYSHRWAGLQITVAELCVALQAVLRRSTANGGTVPAQLVLGMGDSLARETGRVEFYNDAKFEHRVIFRESLGSLNNELSLADQLKSADTLCQASAVIEATLRNFVAAAIGVADSEVDTGRPLFDYGVDSLKAIELRNRVQRDMQAETSVFELLSAMPICDLAAKLVTRSSLISEEAKRAAA